jgi:hypothetical protein
VSNRPVNKTEEFVLGVCRRSFLSLWCDSNPRGKDSGDELCDILVVCDPHVIIVSVKEVKLKGHKSPEVEHPRWIRKAVDESVKQIYGAQRWLASATKVIRRDGTPGLDLPPHAGRRTHRIAVAIGGQGEIPIKSGDFGKGFVHVMSEKSCQDVLTELDTITDLVDYLAAKEANTAAGCRRLVLGSEANLLAWYLLNDRTFPNDVDFFLADDTLWDGLRERRDYQLKKKADADSYDWDRLIEAYVGPNGELCPDGDSQFNGLELALRTMAREPRFNRRLLGRGLREFVEQAMGGSLRARTMCSPSGVIYVVVFFKATEEQQRRCDVLGDRCFLARHTIGSGDTVIGVGFVESAPDIVSPCEVVYCDAREWSPRDDEQAARMKAERGFESKVTTRQVQELEYPRTE